MILYLAVLLLLLTSPHRYNALLVLTMQSVMYGVVGRGSPAVNTGHIIRDGLFAKAAEL